MRTPCRQEGQASQADQTKQSCLLVTESSWNNIKEEGRTERAAAAFEPEIEWGNVDCSSAVVIQGRHKYVTCGCYESANEHRQIPRK